MKIITLIIIALLTFSGCSDEQKEEVKQETSVYTVQYYLTHKDIRKLKLKECRHLKKMTYIQLEDCNNAETSEMKSKQNKLIDL